MNKLFLCLGLSIAISSTVNAATKDSITSELLSAINMLNLVTFDNDYSTAEQQNALTKWDNAVANAKRFVAENSKDLLKRDDTALTSAMAKMDTINNDLSNTIKVIRGSKNPPISRLLTIAAEANRVEDQQRKTSFTLAGKKDANAIIILIGENIRSAAKNLYNKVVAKK